MLRWDLSREFIHNRQMREGELGCRSGERAVFPLPLLQLRAFLEGGHPPPPCPGLREAGVLYWGDTRQNRVSSC